MPLMRRSFLRTLALGLLPLSLGKSAAAPLPPDPWHDAAWMHRWRSAPRLPILEPGDSTQTVLLAALRHGQSLVVHYLGGDACGTERRITPTALYRVEGFPAAYLDAYCHLRHRPRHFRTDRLILSPP